MVAANLYTQRDSNIRKTWFLMTMFLVLVILVGWVLSYANNMPEILYIAVLFSFIMNFFAYWKSDKVALAVSGAKETKREGNEYIYRIVENLSITAGLPTPKIYIINSPQINAFATGRNAEHGVIAVTAGAIEKLENEELEGVIAHELAHIGNRDILLQTVVVVLVGLIAILSDIFFRSQIFGGRDNDSKSGIMMIIGLAAAILAPISASFMQLAISRKREFLADASGALLTRYPEGLARALEKIEQDSVPMRMANNATAHLFISNPFRGKDKSSWLSKLFMTHPPIKERVAALRGMKI